MSGLTTLRNALLNAAKPAVLSANYHLNNYNEVVWVIGSGRSGTTWVTDMLNYKQGFREMLEPCRPHVVADSNFLALNDYRRPGKKDERLALFYAEVFSGRFKHVDVDSAANRLRFKGLMVKDVFANLFAKHLHNLFPNVKPILLLRNPFEVALSMQSKKDWVWMTDPMLFLNQPDLVEDFLLPYVPLITEVSERGDYIEKLLLIWCIINYVPLKQFKKEEILVVFYEDVKRNPSAEVSQMWQFIRGSADVPPMSIPNHVSAKTSGVSTELGKKFTKDEGAWRDKLSATQLKNGNSILDAFGFGDLYSEAGVPNRASLKKFLGS